MVLYYLLLTLCLSLWYSSIIYWPTVYHFFTILPSTSPLPIPMVFFYLMATCLYLFYSTIFHKFPACIYGTILSSTAPLSKQKVLYYLPIPMVLYHILLATAYTNGFLLSSTGSLHIPMLFFYLLLDPCLYLWYAFTFYWIPSLSLG